jgi:hypothetical protein
MIRNFLRSLLVVTAAAACTAERERPLFRLLGSAQTGISFANTITTSDTFNIQTDVYIYNGAGVGIGDLDDDGLPDIYFAGNQVSSRLYLNKGGLRFEDITERAGVATRQWATGVSMVDINADGRLDIYVSVSGHESSRPEERRNLLFINNGDLTFTESAERYAIADTGFTTHSAFLDFDADGCLDLFVLNNSPHDFSRGEAFRTPGQRRGATPGSYNQLYRNTCDGSFENVSTRAGILRDVGYGLGVAVSDLNNDGRADVYVSNDANPNDVLYVGNADGTFTDQAGRWLKRASLAGMGVDIADVNNDGWDDILQVDMMPRDLVTRKRMSGFMTPSSQMELRARGFRDDYSINTLQLSNGVTKDGDVIFSEIARLAGVAATDWSWSALFADFDNDGLKDIFISNGYPKAVNDYDYQTAMFALHRAPDSVAARRKGLEILAKLHRYDQPNFLFRNNGDLTFSDVTGRWGLAQRGISYGAAYGDLDNNGTLDLVVNNIDGPAFVYENLGHARENSARHYLQVRLDKGIGARLTVSVGGLKQHLYYSPYRGYMSSMDDRAHFGLGAAQRVDTLEVRWPDGRRQVLTGLDADRVLKLNASEAANGVVAAPGGGRPTADATPPTLFEAFSVPGLQYLHQPRMRADYSVQPLLPYAISRQGPWLAVADLNRDSLEDLFISGGSGTVARLLVQRRDGSFAPVEGQPWEADKGLEDWGATFFDANGDSLPDLYVASGGYHVAPGSSLLQDRLYINQGGGRFARDAGALPPMLTSTGAVRAGDFTGDGRPDLFVGGRLTPRTYPVPTRSYLLRNEGGRFVDVTRELAPELIEPGGLITDAGWVDFDGDGRLDLVTAGEWMPVQFYRNEGSRFRDVTRSTGLPPMRGWWSSLAVGDFDKDGDSDIIAGNLGLNSSYRTSKDSRFGVYAGDFTGNRSTDVLLTQEIDGVEYTLSGLVPLGRSIYQLALRYPGYAAFARTPVAEIFGRGALDSAVHYQADTFASMLLRNDGKGAFSASPLPGQAQISPIEAIVVRDLDGDGNLDLVVAGNLAETEPNTPPANAGIGLWLKGDGRGGFTPAPSMQSGFLAPRDVAAMATIRIQGEDALLISNTADSLQVFVPGRRQKAEGRRQR